MFVNDESGVIQDMVAVVRSAARKALFSTLMQRRPLVECIDLAAYPIDLMSERLRALSGGALYVRRKPRVREAQRHGGGHERGMRSRYPTHQIAGMRGLSHRQGRDA
jgi:cysteine sulfinate desulfinase/cysteine desulfurase-like protein